MASEFSSRLHSAIPGGAHTYSRGDDQFPSNAPEILTEGKGCSVFDVKGNKYLDFGMGLRSVSIGYAEDSINVAAINGMSKGNNLTRASFIELEAAELLIDTVPTVDMVKFCKNGSNATSAATKLARAFTGRDIIARCSDHPFFSFDDWFIGSTPIKKGIPSEAITNTIMFKYNDLKSFERLLDLYPDQIACVILEPVGLECPSTRCCGQATCTKFPSKNANFLTKLKKLCEKHGIIFILDETITGFRWSLAGAQSLFGVTPDLTIFGKAMANGFSVAAVGGRREIMSLGGIVKKGQERTFLLSSTHGAEMCSLAAFIATIEFIKANNVISKLWDTGYQVKDMINRISQKYDCNKFLFCEGSAVSPTLVTADGPGFSASDIRTLFAQEMVKNKVLMPWIAISYRHNDEALTSLRTALERSLKVCKSAVEGNMREYITGDNIKPVFRKYN